MHSFIKLQLQVSECVYFPVFSVVAVLSGRFAWTLRLLCPACSFRWRYYLWECMQSMFLSCAWHVAPLPK